MATAEKNGLMSRNGFIYRGSVIDANDLTRNGYYRVDSDVVNIPYAGFGILVVINCSGYIVQSYYSGGSIITRKTSDALNWTDWISIS